MLKWLCRIRHKWVYYDNQTPLRVGQLVIKKRSCKRCHLIEIQSLVSGKWYKCEPSPGELRDINLKRLGF